MTQQPDSNNPSDSFDSSNPFIAMTELATIDAEDKRLLDEMYPEAEKETAIVQDNFGKHIEVTVPDCCTPEFFRKVVAAAFTAYLMGKRYPDMAQVSRYLAGSVNSGGLKKLAKVMSTDEYADALATRGIYKTKIANGITAEQSYCLEILTDPSRSRQSMETKLKAAGVSYTKYRSWLKNPLFASVFSTITENMLTEHQGDVHVALVNKATNGDVRAIEYFNKLTGRFDPDRGQVLNLQAIISGLLEIITKNIRDPQILDAVVVDIDKLIAKEAGALPPAPPDIPVVSSAVFDNTVLSNTVLSNTVDAEEVPEFSFGFEAGT